MNAEDIALLVEEFQDERNGFDSSEPWDSERIAVETDRGSGKAGWAVVRRLIQIARETFLQAHNADAVRRGAPGPLGFLAPVSRAGLADAAAGSDPVPLLQWGQTFLPEHFQKPPSAMHRWMAERLDAMRRQRGEKLNVLGPRGGAKSTLGSLAYPLREALEGREPYIWLVSDSKEQARRHLENLKAELLDNPWLARAYPHAAGRGPVWRAGAVVLRNGVTIEAFGAGQRIRGRRSRANRPTLIVCDDLQNDAHMESALQRDHARTWFHGALLKAGTPLTNVVSLATALHREALAMELCGTPGWTSRVFRSIDPWPQHTALWEQWETLYANPEDPRARQTARAFFDRHRGTMEAGAAVLWPEVEDLYALMCVRAESGRSAFEREKQNSPVSPELCEWPEVYFGEHLWFDQWPTQPIVKILALDPSKGADARRGDYSAFVRLAVDRRKMIYVEADLRRQPTPELVAEGVELYRQFRPDAFGVEANQFQELLAGEFEMEFRRQGMLGVRPWLICNEVNKRVRLRRLGPHLAARRLRMKADSPGTRLLVDQLRQFPTGRHDDGPDALEMAIRLAEEMLFVPPGDALGNRLPIGN